MVRFVVSDPPWSGVELKEEKDTLELVGEMGDPAAETDDEFASDTRPPPESNIIIGEPVTLFNAILSWFAHSQEKGTHPPP